MVDRRRRPETQLCAAHDPSGVPVSRPSRPPSCMAGRRRGSVCSGWWPRACRWCGRSRWATWG